MINWKVRFKNPVFLFHLLLAVLAPVTAYLGISYQDLSTWGSLGSALLQAISNPYIVAMIIISVYQSVNDPTVDGHKDSQQALTYTKPKKG